MVVTRATLREFYHSGLRLSTVFLPSGPILLFRDNLEVLLMIQHLQFLEVQQSVDALLALGVQIAVDPMQDQGYLPVARCAPGQLQTVG